MGIANAGKPDQITFLAGRADMLFFKAHLIARQGLPWYNFESPFFTAAVHLTRPPIKAFRRCDSMQKTGLPACIGTRQEFLRDVQASLQLCRSCHQFHNRFNQLPMIHRLG
jgi:hypothetical protein